MFWTVIYAILSFSQNNFFILNSEYATYLNFPRAAVDLNALKDGVLVFFVQTLKQNLASP